MKDGRCILTGCDANQFWLLPWWFMNVKRHMPKNPIVVADFGLTPEMKDHFKDDVEFISVSKIADKRTWFMKPKAMLSSPYKYTCWLDIDCEVLKPFGEIFRYAKGEKLGLTPDPYSYANNWAYWQSGVVVFRDKPKILERWTKRSLLGIDRGDQEALYALIKNTKEYVNEMPAKYQWLRLDIKYRGFNRDAKIIHWTGPRGKDKIRNMILDP